MSAILAHPESPNLIAAVLRRAVEVDVLVDNAVALNDQTIARRLAMQVVRTKAVGSYTSVAAAERARGRVRNRR